MSHSNPDRESPAPSNRLLARVGLRIRREFRNLAARESSEAGTNQFVLRLTLLTEGRISIQASFPGGSTMTVSRLPAGILDAEPSEQQSTAAAELDGSSLFRVLFPAPILRHLEEFIARDSEGYAPLVLEIEDEQIWRIPWERMCQAPGRPALSMSGEVCLIRRAVGSDEIQPAQEWAPDDGKLRVGLLANTLDTTAVHLVHDIAEHANIEIAVSTAGTESLGFDPHILISLDRELPLEGVKPARLHVTLSSDLPGFEQARRSPPLLVIPVDLPESSRDVLVRELCHALADGSTLQQALAQAFSGAATELPESSDRYPLPAVTSTLTTTEAIVTPPSFDSDADDHANDRRVLSPQELISNWLRNVIATALTSVSFLLLGALMFGLNISSDTRFSLSKQLFPGIILDLSALEERILGMIAIASAILLLMYVIVFLLVLTRFRVPAARGTFSVVGSICLACFNQRALAMILGATLVFVGAFVYQQYLWRSLAVADGAVGFAITREAGSDLFETEFARNLQNQSQSQEIVIRRLPVRFGGGTEAIDVERARSLGARLGVEAVIVYHSAETSSGIRYTASIVFVDPDVGLIIDQSGAAASTQVSTTDIQSQVTEKSRVESPTLMVDADSSDPGGIQSAIEEIVAVASGIIAYRNDRFTDAIAYLEPVSLAESNNQGIASYYLGNAYRLDFQLEPAELAYLRAIGHFERLDQTRSPGPQDRLIQVKTLLELGMLSMGYGQWDDAIDYYQRGVEHYAPLYRQAGVLTAPHELRATYARIFAQLADAHRFRARVEGDSDQDVRHFQQRSNAELERLLEFVDADDTYRPHVILEAGRTHYMLGNCYQAIDLLEQTIDAHPLDNAIRLELAALSHSSRSPYYLLRLLDEAAALEPDNARVWKLKGFLTSNLAINFMLVDPEFVVDREEERDFRYFDPDYLREARTYFERVLTLEPNDMTSIYAIAWIEIWLARSELDDFTSLYNGDQFARAIYRHRLLHDPDRRGAAGASYDEAIYQLRRITDELEPDNPEYALTLLFAYGQVHGIHVLEAKLSPDPDEAMLARIERDGQRIRQLADELLDNLSPAGNEHRAAAWRNLLDLINNERELYRMFTPAGTQREELDVEYRQHVRTAVEFVEGVEPRTLPEFDNHIQIFSHALVVDQMLEHDERNGEHYNEEKDRLQDEYDRRLRDQVDHVVTNCQADAERSAATRLLEDDPRAAEWHLQRSLELDPNNFAAYNNLGVARFYQDDFQGALELIELQLQHEPEPDFVWGNLGIVHVARGDVSASEDAFGEYFRRLDELPSQHRMSLLRVTIKEMQKLGERRPDLAGNVAEALPLFQEYLIARAGELGETPQYSTLVTNLGRTALFTNRPELARDLLAHSIELDPYQPSAQVNHALALLALGEDLGQRGVELDKLYFQPIWIETLIESQVGPVQVIQLVEEEIERFKTSITGHTIAVEMLTDQLPRPGITDDAYAGRLLGVELTWDPTRFTSVNEETEEADYLVITPASIPLQVISFQFHSFIFVTEDLDTCVESGLLLAGEERLSADFDIEPEGLASRLPASTPMKAASVSLTLQDTPGWDIEFSMVVECAEIVPDRAFLQLVWWSPVAFQEFGEQLLSELLETLTLPPGLTDHLARQGN